MIVRLSGQKSNGTIARLEALLAGMILTVSTAYAATVCPLYWTQVQLEADLRNRVAITNAVDRWYLERGAWPQDDLQDLREKSPYLGGIPTTSPLNAQPYRLDPVTHRLRISGVRN
jgi:hypothetical protein